jgi:hypothetical protein
VKRESVFSPDVNSIFAHTLIWGKEETELKAVKSVNLYYEGIWTENDCRQDKC